LKCPWCHLTSSKQPFHAGSFLDDDENLVFKAICPKCTNVYYPNIQKTLAKNPSKVVGLVMEEDIIKYCQDNHDDFLFRLKGRVPKTSQALRPDTAAQQVPEKYRR